MEALDKQVRRAHRRLLFQQFLATLSWTWFAGLGVAIVAIVAGKIWPTDVPALAWAAAWLVGGSVGGCVAAGIWTLFHAISPLDAACEIDRRFDLKQRVSTVWALSPTELSSEAGQAVLNDALERIGRLRVTDKFAVGLDVRAWMPLLPATVGVLVALFVPPRGTTETAAIASTTAATAQIKNSTRTLEKRLAEKRAEAHEKGLQDADDLLKKIEDGTRKLRENQAVDSKQALLELNDLTKDLERRRDKLLAEDKLKQRLNQLQETEHGPAEKFAQAMKNGDFKRAAEELKKLQDRLAKAELNEQEREKLADQLDRMQQNMQKALAARAQARQELQRQIAEQRQSGNRSEAERLQKQLDQLDQQDGPAQQMSEMAQKLNKAGQCLKQGDAKGASMALDAMRGDLKAAAQSGDELAMLDEALDQIGDAKSSMSCKECQGAGCKACGAHEGKGRPGPGIGKGRGAGARPEDKTDTGFYDSKVTQNVRRGAAVIAGEAAGPNRKGDVREAIKNQFESARNEAADPLSSQRLPRDYREHAKKYFESLREGTK